MVVESLDLYFRKVKMSAMLFVCGLFSKSGVEEFSNTNMRVYISRKKVLLSKRDPLGFNLKPHSRG